MLQKSSLTQQIEHTQLAPGKAIGREEVKKIQMTEELLQV